MGKIDDPDAVVDSKAKVIGVTGLRVVDASSFALLPPGHPQVCHLVPSHLCITDFPPEYDIRVGREDCRRHQAWPVGRARRSRTRQLHRVN